MSSATSLLYRGVRPVSPAAHLLNYAAAPYIRYLKPMDRWGYRIGGFVARRAVTAGARMIQRAWRRRRARKKNGVIVPARSLKKRRIQSVLCQDKEEGNTQTEDALTIFELTSLVDTGTDVGDASREYIDVSGIHLCHIVANPSTRYPIVYHICVLEPKFGDWSDSLTWLGSIKREFFTSPESTDNGRLALDFDNAALGKWQKNCLCINSMKWNIYMHKKCIVNCVPDSSADRIVTMEAGSSTVYCQRYVKINKRFYRNNGALRRPLFVVVFHEILEKTVTTGPGITFDTIHKIYHKKP